MSGSINETGSHGGGSMAYREINKENAGEYVKSVSDFFAPDANLSIYEMGESEEDGDGYINFVYRIYDEDGNSLILKQARENPRNPTAKGLPIQQTRNLIEAEIMKIKHAIVPDYIPEVYYIDEENHLYLCEDCKDLKVLRMELIKGKTFPKFAKQIGEFIAKTNFYTSEIYMDPVQHRRLQEHFMNSKMRQVFEVLLFLDTQYTHRDVKNSPVYSPEREAMGEAVWNDKAVQTELLKMRHLHMKKSECLVHGDLHTSNVLIDDENMKIIDQEYTYMGLASCDTGYLVGSILYEYIRWGYVDDFDEEKREELSRYAFDTIHDLIETYIEVYKECWEKDAKDMYRDYEGYRESLMRDFIQEVTGSAGAQILSRIGTLGQLPDVDTIEDDQMRFDCCRVCLMMARQLILNWENVQTLEEMMDLIENSTKAAKLITTAAAEV